MILDRVKKRIETDLDDTELQLMIDEANQDVIDKFGPHSNPDASITVSLDGYRKKIVVDRPIDTSKTVSITEYVEEYGWGETAVHLQSNDYRIWPSGYTIERLPNGTNSASQWPKRVEVTYVPVNDGNQREEVIIKLVMLAVEYDAVSVRTVGEVSANNLDYQAERDKIFSRLNPRQGMYMQ